MTEQERGALPATADVVVIGAGIVGCSVAYHLARRGISAVVLERATRASGASSANPGTISLVTKQPGPSLDLALLTFERFATLSAELERDVEYERCGVLVVAESDLEMEFLSDLAQRQRVAGAPVETVDAAGARLLNPLLSEAALGGTYCHLDAHVNPHALTLAYAVAAERRGATIVEMTVAIAVSVDRGAICSVQTDRGRVATKWLVNCAGADATAVGAMVGVRHDVVPRVGRMIVLAAPIDLPEVKVVTARQLRAKHLADYKAGGLSFGYTRKQRSRSVILGTTNEAAATAQTPAEATRAILGYAARLMPRLVQLPVTRTTRGVRPTSAAGPIIGRGGGPEGYLAATGHGGDGVSLSAITGEIIAEIIADGAAGASLEMFVARRTAVTTASPVAG